MQTWTTEERLKIIHNGIEFQINEIHKTLPFPHREGEECLVPLLALKVRRWVEEISGLPPKDDYTKKIHEELTKDVENAEAKER